MSIQDRSKLMDDIYDNNVEAVVEFINKDQNINFEDDFSIPGQGFVKYTPLLLAIHKNHHRIVELLLPHVDNINQITGELVYHSWTPLIMSIHVGDNDMINMIFGSNPDVNVGTKYFNPLEYSIARGNFRIVKELVKKGAIVTTTNSDRTLLDLGVGSGNIGLVTYLLDELKLNPNQTNNVNLISMAIRSSTYVVDYPLLKMMDLLKLRGVDINQPITDLPIIAAIIEGKFIAVKYLIDNGSDINQPVKSKTPIEYAIETGIDQIIEYIILNDRFEKPTKTLSFKKNQEYYELLIDKNKQNQQFIDFVRDYNYVGFKYRELFETNDLDTVNEIIELNKNQVITVTDIDYVLDLLRQIEASKSNQLLHKKKVLEYYRIYPLGRLSGIPLLGIHLKKHTSYWTKTRELLGLSILDRTRLIKLDKTSPEYRSVKTLFEDTTPAMHRPDDIIEMTKFRIDNIFYINIPVHEQLWNTRVNKSPYTKLLWHGTNSQNILSILRTGFYIVNSIDDTKSSFVSSMFGEGIYFADLAYKSLFYSDQLRSTCIDNKTGVGWLILSKVDLGNTYYAKDPGSISRTTPNYDHYHSITALASTTSEYHYNLKYNEYVVLPKHLNRICPVYLLKIVCNTT